MVLYAIYMLASVHESDVSLPNRSGAALWGFCFGFFFTICSGFIVINSGIYIFCVLDCLWLSLLFSFLNEQMRSMFLLTNGLHILPLPSQSICSIHFNNCYVSKK